MITSRESKRVRRSVERVQCRQTSVPTRLQPIPPSQNLIDHGVSTVGRRNRLHSTVRGSTLGAEVVVHLSVELIRRLLPRPAGTTTRLLVAALLALRRAVGRGGSGWRSLALDCLLGLYCGALWLTVEDVSTDLTSHVNVRRGKLTTCGPRETWVQRQLVPPLRRGQVRPRND